MNKRPIAALVIALLLAGTAGGETKPCPQTKPPSTSPWQGSKLIRAILDSNTRAAASLIEEGAHLNERDNFGNTPLVLALTSRERLEPIGIVSKARRQALLQREEDARKKIVVLLLAKGADPNVSGPLGRTPLMQVSTLIEDKVWDLKIATDLLAKGAHLDAQDDYGNTPLILAADNGLTAIVDLFLKHGADPTTRNCRNETALSLAKQKHLIEVQRRFESQVKP